MAKRKQTIPDLRAEHTEITFEHCHILLVQLGNAMVLMEGNESVRQIADEIDPMTLQTFYKNNFPMPEFNRLFSSDIGKGVLVGCFVMKILEGKLAADDSDC
jgi:hypothetical protein